MAPGADIGALVAVMNLMAEARIDVLVRATM